MKGQVIITNKKIKKNSNGKGSHLVATEKNDDVVPVVITEKTEAVKNLVVEEKVEGIKPIVAAELTPDEKQIKAQASKIEELKTSLGQKERAMASIIETHDAIAAGLRGNIEEKFTQNKTNVSLIEKLTDDLETEKRISSEIAEKLKEEITAQRTKILNLTQNLSSKIADNLALTKEKNVLKNEVEGRYAGSFVTGIAIIMILALGVAGWFYYESCAIKSQLAEQVEEAKRLSSLYSAEKIAHADDAKSLANYKVAYSANIRTTESERQNAQLIWSERNQYKQSLLMAETKHDDLVRNYNSLLSQNSRLRLRIKKLQSQD